MRQGDVPFASFHGKRLTDHASGECRESRPIRSELKFHRNSRHDPHSEIDGEDLRPEACAFVIAFIVLANGDHLQYNDQQP